MTPEGRVKKMVKGALDRLGSDCWRFMPVQSGYGSVALDYLIAVKGRFVAIETKAPGKRLTSLQESTKAAIEAAGGLVFVVWDETSLELAMKIILALEFAPNGNDTISRCVEHVREQTNYRGALRAVRASEDEGACEQHLRTFLKDEAAD